MDGPGDRLDARDVKFLTLRMRSPSLARHINGLTSKDYKTITLDRPGPHNRPRVHEDKAVMLTSYPGTCPAGSAKPDLLRGDLPHVAKPADVLAAWRCLTAHPAFWTYLVPNDLAEIDPREVDEATWARIEAGGWLSDGDGLANLDVSLDSSGDRRLLNYENCYGAGITEALSHTGRSWVMTGPPTCWPPAHHPGSR